MQMRNGKTISSDDMAVEVWRCLGEMAVEILIRMFNEILENRRVPKEWRNVLVWI